VAEIEAEEEEGLKPLERENGAFLSGLESETAGLYFFERSEYVPPLLLLLLFSFRKEVTDADALLLILGVGVGVGVLLSLLFVDEGFVVELILLLCTDEICSLPAS
jgi:hypothetical protein